MRKIPAYRGRAFVWLGFRRMQSEISRAGRPVGHAAKIVCELASRRHLTRRKNVRRRSAGRCGEQRWSSERLAAVLLGFWAAFEATSWGSRWGAEPLAARLQLTTQLDFEPLRRLPACLRHRAMSTNRVEWLGTFFFVNVCYRFMDQWMSSGDRERPDRALLAELWRVFPPQPNEPFPAVHLRCLFCQSRSSSEINSHAAISDVT